MYLTKQIYNIDQIGKHNYENLNWVLWRIRVSSNCADKEKPQKNIWACKVRKSVKYQVDYGVERRTALETGFCDGHEEKWIPSDCQIMWKQGNVCRRGSC